MLHFGPSAFNLLCKTRTGASPYRLTASPDTQPDGGSAMQAARWARLRSFKKGHTIAFRKLATVTHSFEPLCTASITDQTQDFVEALQRCMPFLNALVGALRPSSDSSPNHDFSWMAVAFLQQVLGLTAFCWLFVNGVNLVLSHAPLMCTASSQLPAARTPPPIHQERKAHCLVNLSTGPVSMACPEHGYKTVSAPATSGLLLQA